MKRPTRVLLADDHALLTAGLKMIIDEWEEFEVVGIAADGEQAAALCDTLAPDLIIMDMQMPGLSGAEATALIKKKHPGVRVLALTTFENDETVAEAMKAGCDGFLLKVIEKEKLRACLVSVAGGMNVYDENAMVAYNRRIAAAERKATFSERELQIFSLLSRGFTNAEMGETLRLRTGTVKNLVSMLLSKTGCVSRAQLVRYAAENGIE